MLVAVAAALLVLTPLVGPADAADAADKPDVRDDEILVKFRPDTPADLQLAAHAQAGGRVVREVEALDVLVVEVPRGQARDLLPLYQHNPHVEYAELNGIAEADWVPNDSYYANQWALNNVGQSGGKVDADIDAPQAWERTRGSSGVKIAILDTGISKSHPDLAGKVTARKNFTSGSSDDDGHGHGTHVAGTAAAIGNNGQGVSGVCPNCSLVSGKVLDDNARGSYDWIAKGILWAAGCDSSSCGSPRARVINLSLGGTLDSATLKGAVDKAWSRGVVLTCAAGNFGNGTKLYPAAYGTCIAVAATDRKDQRASFSSYGSGWVDVAAPGVDILSTQRLGGYSYGYGTSTASPHVAGLAGLLWSQGLDGASSVRSKLESTADRIAGTGTYWSKGRVNACKAVGASGC